jgi:hypothetical protein
MSLKCPWICWYMALNGLEKSLNLILPHMYEPWWPLAVNWYTYFARVGGGLHFFKNHRTIPTSKSCGILWKRVPENLVQNPNMKMSKISLKNPKIRAKMSNFAKILKSLLKNGQMRSDLKWSVEGPVYTIPDSFYSPWIDSWNWLDSRLK